MGAPALAEEGDDDIANRPLRGCTIDMPDGPQIEATYVFDPWRSGIVPYEFNANVSDSERAAMLVAMADWEKVANIDFRPRNDEDDYIHIRDDTVNSSPVGKGSGKRTIKIFNWNFEFTMAHELCHTLGFWHEQSRPDRDTYVTINLGSIQDDMEFNFDKKAGALTYGTYDFDSVMHYGQCLFSTCANCGADLANCRTITVKAPWNTQWQSAIGQTTHLSVLDMLSMQMLYPERNWVFVDRSYLGTENGSFREPYNTFPEGATAVPAGGTVVIQPGTMNGNGTYTKAMRLWAPLGNVTLD